MPTTMKLIAKTTLGSDAANVEFTSIPGTYTDLMLALVLRSDRSTGNAREDSIKVRFNGSTSNIYSSRMLYGNGSSALSASESSVAYATAYTVVPSNDNTASTFSNTTLYIPNYAGSTNKSFNVEGAGENNNAASGLGTAACLWSSTAAITSILVYPYNGSNWKSGSAAYLYGITKA